MGPCATSHFSRAHNQHAAKKAFGADFTERRRGAAPL